MMIEVIRKKIKTMTKADLKKLIKQYPGRYKECSYRDEIKDRQFVTVDGDDESGGPLVGIVVMIDYPESGKCIIDTDIDERIDKGTIIMDSTMLIFLENVLSNVKKICFEVMFGADDKSKSELVKIDLPVYNLTFIGSDLSEALKKTAQFFDDLPKIAELMKDGTVRTSARKILLDGAKNVD